MLDIWIAYCSYPAALFSELIYDIVYTCTTAPVKGALELDEKVQA